MISQQHTVYSGSFLSNALYPALFYDVLVFHLKTIPGGTQSVDSWSPEGLGIFPEALADFQLFPSLVETR